MEYRRLGPTGLKVSVLGFGSWVSFGNQLDERAATECMAAAFDAGVNFFDNAQSYALGESERIMGAALARLGPPRDDYVVSTKFFFGIRDGVNTRETLNRKYLLGAMDGSLERLGLDFVDLALCHRPDPDTPVEETVWTMHDIVTSGRARYWGTSEWPASRIRSALEIADRHHLRKPVVEQPQYNLLARERVEHEYASLYEGPGLGLTTWGPLASGVLTGKYLEGIPPGSRLSLPRYRHLGQTVLDPAHRGCVEAVVTLARQLGCTAAQLAIAWCARNPHVSCVITGASSPAQVRENVSSLEVLARLDAAAARLEASASPASGRPLPVVV